LTLHIADHVSLQNANTLALPVFARYYFRLTELSQVPEIMAFVEQRSLSFLLIGGGSNIVFTQDYSGLVIHNEIGGISVKKGEGDTYFVEAGGGEVWETLVQYCLVNGYCGIENLALIPGTVGAAPVQNIGAYGVELSHIFHSLTGWDCREHCWKTLTIDDCSFSYRDSIFKQTLKNGFLITSVVLRLSGTAAKNISYPALRDALVQSGIETPSSEDIVTTVSKVRNSKLPNPNELPNAGSFFKNPIVNQEKFTLLQRKFSDIVSFPVAESSDKKLSAGWLVQEAGWKGKRLGPVGMHDKQALVLINYGGASCRDVMNLANAVQHSVAEKFNIELEVEPDII
jgi:UDP-N-acetylmuramate dehydrogenase